MALVPKTWGYTVDRTCNYLWAARHVFDDLLARALSVFLVGIHISYWI